MNRISDTDKASLRDAAYGLLRDADVGDHDPELGRLFRSSVIDDAMLDAARGFQRAFALASLDPLRAMPIMRVPGTGREPSITEMQVFARKRLHRAMQALGGHDSRAGSVIWHVVGGGMSVRQWAMRQRWGGRAMRIDEAQGMLVAALGVLAGASR